MKTQVLEKMPDYFWQLIKQKGWQVNFTEEYNKNSEILIIRTHTKADRVLLSKYPFLKMIIRAGSGFDNVDAREAEKRKIIVCNTPRANAVSAAEHTISLMLALIKQHQYGKERVLTKSWKTAMDNCWEISDLKVLLVGVGHVGTHVANKLQDLGASLKGVDPFLDEDIRKSKKIDWTTYQEGITWCNMISYHCPLYSKTQGYFNLDVVKQCKNPIWLVNTARGGIVDENAVKYGLENKSILGFAADVFTVEPWQGNTFSSGKNVYLTPHIAAYTLNAKIRLSRQTLQVWEKYVFEDKIQHKIDLMLYR